MEGSVFYMDRHLVIFTTDKRQENLGRLFAGEKRRITWAMPKEPFFFPDLKKEEESEWIYVLPTPVAKLEGKSLLKEYLQEELIRRNEDMCGNVKVFGGVLDPEWVVFLEENQILYWDFMKLPDVVEGNAQITAEGTVAQVLSLAEYSILGQSIMVTGYGYCGQKIAKLFAQMGANVTVVARSQKVREGVEADGLKAIDFYDMPKALPEYKIVINTVPALVLKEDGIRQLPPDACIIDIASKPGGTDFEAAEKYGIRAKLALGLPGIYTTSSSAMLLKNAILKYAPLKENENGGKLWIYQIII
jgi:dipicolinate synthase subunit A